MVTNVLIDLEGERQGSVHLSFIATGLRCALKMVQEPVKPMASKASASDTASSGTSNLEDSTPGALPLKALMGHVATNALRTILPSIQSRPKDLSEIHCHSARLLDLQDSLTGVGTIMIYPPDKLCEPKHRYIPD